MSLTAVLIGLTVFLCLVIVIMLITFTGREFAFFRQLEAIQNAIRSNASVSEEIATIVESTLDVLNEFLKNGATRDIRSQEDLRQINECIANVVMPTIIKISAYLETGKMGTVNLNSYHADAKGTQVNQGNIHKPEF